MPGWRNGRRGGLKIRFSQESEGSTPFLGTKPFQIDMFEKPLKIKEGHVVAPERTGLGINLHHSAISKYQVI